MSSDILTPPGSPPPDKHTNLSLHESLWMPIAQRPMVSFSHVVQQQDVQPRNPQNERPRDSGRVLILCFDGTGNKFGENSNIVRFFRALKKDNIKDHKKRQVVYYQPGIGTYNKKAWTTFTMNKISAAVDFAVAPSLDDHVKDGYKFLIQNYRVGDKLCLFGFSRGAHTARVVAGMIYKVGILPRENLQQVDFAFNIYMTTGYEGYKLSQEFKKTFASHVEIDFVGVWDTVSSVGVIPQTHPYTSINYSIKCFRHALALDERRTRFRPNVWCELTEDREQELDIDLPSPEEIDKALAIRDEWQYTAPERDHADVKEVWFSGSHSDVGGGSHTTKRNHSLSSIPLRWMIKECIQAKTGIQFDMDYLRDALDFDFHDLVAGMKNEEVADLGEAYQGIEEYVQDSFEKKEKAKEKEKEEAKPDSQLPVANGSAQTHFHGFRHYIHDVFDQIFDQLVIAWWFWWILEILPLRSTYQDLQGNWIRLRRRNFGRGRYIPFYKNEILVHETVKLRIESKKQTYTPNARNWDTVKDSPMLKYVS